jgi:hypothetical protein
MRAQMPAAICVVAPIAQPKLIRRAVAGRAVSSRTIVDRDQADASRLAVALL